MSRWNAANLARHNRQRIATTRKYGNEPQVVDGHLFDSKLEAKRYGELKLLQMVGQIHDLKVHEVFDLHANGERLGYYEADFSYLEDGQRVIEDCKGVLTPLYRWKKKHLKAEYGINISEIKS